MHSVKVDLLLRITVSCEPQTWYGLPKSDLDTKDKTPSFPWEPSALKKDPCKITRHHWCIINKHLQEVYTIKVPIVTRLKLFLFPHLRSTDPQTRCRKCEFVSSFQSALVVLEIFQLFAWRDLTVKKWHSIKLQTDSWRLMLKRCFFALVTRKC